MPDYGYLLPTRGIVLSSEDNSGIASRTRADLVEMSRLVESLGFSDIWIGDSVLAKPRHEPLTTLAAAATATESVGLGTAVYLPVLRDPAHVAHMTATLDQLSGGRFKFGIGVGIGPDVETEHANLDVPFRQRGPRMDELLDIVTQLWEGEPVTYDGRFYDLEEGSIGFGPLQSPPIYIPTAAFDPTEGFPEPIENRLVEHGDGWMPTGIAPDTYAESLDGVYDLLDDAGRDTDTFDAAAYIDVAIADDEDDALEMAQEFFDQYFPAQDPPPKDELRDRPIGTPAQVIETIDDYVDAGVETMCIRFTAPDQRLQVRRFADAMDDI